MIGEASRRTWRTAGTAGETLLRARRRIIGAALLVCLLCAVLVAVGGSDAAEAQSTGTDVRIVARRLVGGKVEFGLQQRRADASWSERLLPSSRFFPADADVGKWLAGSPLGLAAADVRIVARRLVGGKVEFGLQQRRADASWADRLLPSKRLFPVDVAVGRWLSSSPLRVQPAGSSGGGAAVPGAAAGTDRSSCTFERSMSEIAASVFQVVTEAGIGTAFYVGDNEFLTAYHVIEGARTIRLQNWQHTLRQVGIVGVDEPSDVALLRASGNGIGALRFGDEPSLGRGARIAVVGYPLNESDGAATIVSGLLSARLYNTEHDYVFYLQTDAAANPGNSGGPVINTCGEVIGLVVEKVVHEAVEGIIYAVTEGTVRDAVKRARRNGPGLPTESAAGVWEFAGGPEDGEPHLLNDSEDYRYEDALGSESSPTLVITCRSDELAVYVWWDARVAADAMTDEIAVQYWFDDGEEINEGWYESTKNQAVFARTPWSFVRSAQRAEEVTVWVWNPDEEIIGGALFQLDGLERELSNLDCF